MTTLDWLIVFVLNAGVIAYGFYLSRGTRTSSQWFLGARALPWWVVGLSMFATNVDNADLVGITSQASTEGIHVLTVYTFGTMVGGILCAFLIVPAMYRARFYTNAEYLEARYGTSARVISALIQIQYRTSMLGLMIWTIHILLTDLVGLSNVKAWALVVAMVVLAGIYTAWGGLRSVVMTDAIQGVIMMIGALVIFSAVWHEVGGWSGMLEKLDGIGERPEIQIAAPDLVHASRYHGKEGITPALLIVLGWTIVASGYWTVNHTQTMRLMGTRSLWDMKMAALFGTALGIPIMFITIALGIFGRALIPDLGVADTMYATLAAKYLDPGLRGLVVAGILAAGISTFDSMGSALSAVFTRDIYARLLVRDRDDAHYLRVTRYATVGILLIGFAYLPFIWMQDKMIEAFLTLIPVFVTPLFTIYLVGAFTSAHRDAGLVGLLFGGLYGLIALIDRQVYDVTWLPVWFTGKWFAFAWSMWLTCAAMAVTTGLRGKSEPRADPVGDAGHWLARSRLELPPLKEHPFKTSVPVLLNPVWFAVALLAATLYLTFVTFW